MELPNQTAAIFDRLAKGQFISANSTDPNQRLYFQLLTQHESAFSEFFNQIDFKLHRGDGYYYFSRSKSLKSWEDKKDRVERYIDWLDLLRNWRPKLGAGYQFSFDELLADIQSHAKLKRKLYQFVPRGHPDSLADSIRTWLRQLERESFVEPIDKGEQYQVLYAFSYLDHFIQQLVIR
ncbi:condensin complex protein MksE [Pontibacter sp. G13]|uniref:condensin complex protein MksE n=1 Tax=Pontibacter sp. G13 TaxID=3074898 RepID=UPI00288BAF47|nr:hypothetical protein [Pontibacter sp. G13]WNJ21460.1 hypothetical protein RJD25_13405 [Pontibacter sp. G13]